MTAKEKLRLVVDELSEAEAEDALRYLAQRHDRDDALLELLEGAPEGGEPASADEDAGADEAWEDYRRGASVPLERLRRELP